MILPIVLQVALKATGTINMSRCFDEVIKTAIDKTLISFALKLEELVNEMFKLFYLYSVTTIWQYLDISTYHCCVLALISLPYNRVNYSIQSRGLWNIQIGLMSKDRIDHWPIQCLNPGSLSEAYIVSQTKWASKYVEFVHVIGNHFIEKITLVFLHLFTLKGGGISPFLLSDKTYTIGIN